MGLRPLHDRVIVQKIEPDAKSPGGIYIPDAAKDRPQEGRVLAVGPGKRDEHGNLHEPGVKAGDRILFGKYAGSESAVEGEDILVLREDEILGVIE